MTNQQGAPEALRVEAAYGDDGKFIGYRLLSSGANGGLLVWADQKAMPGFRIGDHFVPGYREVIDYKPVALVEAQQPAAHVQNPAEIEHVAGDVSKTGAESNMAQQPAPSAAAAVSDEDEALDLLATLFDAWESGTQCYEEPESSDGFLGHALRLDDEVFHRCADLLNRRRGKQPAPTAQADSQPCPTCAALARTVMLDQVSFDRKPDCYGIRQITDDEGIEEWEDIRTSPDVAREEANDMMATGRGEIYEVVPLWTTPQPSPTPQADSQPAPVLDESAARDECKRKWLAEDEDCNLLEAYDRGWKDRAARAPADSVMAPAGGVVEYTPMLDDEGRMMVGASHHYTAENIRALVAEYKALEAGAPEALERYSNSDHRTRAGVLWRVISALADEVPFAQPAKAADSVQDLQPVHDAVTIDLLNERVAYLERKLKEADSVLEDADPIRALIAEHAAILDQNESAYFELCYHRATGWMAWITDKPLCMPPVVNPDRKVLAQGQGDTADEACRDAARKQGGA